jgi:UDP-N-acetylmuramoyl-L-alanyl-D-glutamate--2,6-diaminopimelate ligase
MTRNQLARILGCEVPDGEDVAITSATEDSRRVGPGAVFFAVHGLRSDGHAFAEVAAKAGAVAIVGARSGVKTWAGIPYFRAASPRRVLGEVAHALAGHPSRTMTVIGVTGTNGKTSTVLLARQILETNGYQASGFGTLGSIVGEQAEPMKHTTPFGEDMVRLFVRARDAGATHVVMEVSSHAIEQDRIAGIDFRVAAFTNLTQDHLDYHENMEEYRRAKLKLFEGIDGPGKFAVVNRDDPSADVFIQASRVPCYTFGRLGDCRAADIRTEERTTVFTAQTLWGDTEVTLRMLGRHNVSNALCAITIGCGMGLPVERVAEGVAALKNVPGRFEHVDAGQPFRVIVDYAHTEDGLRNVLQAAREICRGAVIVVFGCGGDRDKTKRPKMGKAAAELADFAILTSDNPRTEDPDQILREVEVGMERAGRKRDKDYWVLRNRAEAIRRAIDRARPGDLVMIAGKGHEDYQIIGTERIHFDDREAVRAALANRQTR